MSSGTLEIRGSILVRGDACPPTDGSSGTKTVSLALRCASSFFAAIGSSDKAIQVTSPSGFVDVPYTDELDQIELLYLFARSPVTLRVGADVARLVSTGTPGLPFGGGETLTVDIDGVTVAVVFTAIATAQAAANEINAAAALLNLGFLPARVTTAGLLEIASQLTGKDGSVVVTGGTGQVGLGFAAGTNDTAEGAGEDIPVEGLHLVEYGKSSSAPQRIQIKGTALIDVLAAGTAA